MPYPDETFTTIVAVSSDTIPHLEVLMGPNELLVGGVGHVEFVHLLTKSVLPLSVLPDEEGIPA